MSRRGLERKRQNFHYLGTEQRLPLARRAWQQVIHSSQDFGSRLERLLRPKFGA
jgi:hypothetical protein